MGTAFPRGVLAVQRNHRLRTRLHMLSYCKITHRTQLIPGYIGPFIEGLYIIFLYYYNANNMLINHFNCVSEPRYSMRFDSLSLLSDLLINDKLTGNLINRE